MNLIGYFQDTDMHYKMFTAATNMNMKAAFDDEKKGAIAKLKYKYGNRHFWSEGFYVSTVGLNDQTVAKYIREQEGHDIAMDKLSVKEYQNPFEDKEMKKENKKEIRR